MPPRKRRQSALHPPIPSGTALAKLDGKIFYDSPQLPQPFNYFVTQRVTKLGRSFDSITYTDNPTLPAQQGVHVGLGLSNKLSRHHATLSLDTSRRTFYIECNGKNGISVTLPSSGKTILMTPNTSPVQLESRALIHMGESIFCFLLPLEYPVAVRKPREWIKAESHLFRTLLVRFGYGRWGDIIKAASGKLATRGPTELVPVARKFVARCYYHCHPVYFPNSKFSVEAKTMDELLRQDYTRNESDYKITSDIDVLIKNAKQEAEPDEHRRYLRWARRLRVLHRLRCIVSHWTLDSIASGDFKINTPRPTPGWTDQDDVDLILGTYKHGVGQIEMMRRDRQFGFYDRYLPLPPSRRGKNSSKSKADDMSGKEDHDHDDVDDVVDEDEEEILTGNGNGNMCKNVKQEPELSQNVEVKQEPSVKVEDVMEIANEPNKPSTEVKQEDIKVKIDTTQNADDNEEAEKATVENADDDDDFVEDAPTQENRVMFPCSDASMKRLKSIINTCMKMYDRDMREIRKQTEAENKAEKRKLEQEERKKTKNAERERIKSEKKRARSQVFTKRETVDFEKVLANFGVFFESGDALALDWKKFIEKAPQFELKDVETLHSTFLQFDEESRRLAELMTAKADDNQERVKALEELPSQTMFTQLTEERSEKVQERLSFFRTLRLDVLPNPLMDRILTGCKKTRDLPIWWKSKHDWGLLTGVEKHGLNSWDALFKDESLPFLKSSNRHSEAYSTDTKMMRKGAFPKGSIAVKRAMNLVRDFVSNVNDPQFMRRIQTSTATEKKDEVLSQVDHEAKLSEERKENGTTNGNGFVHSGNGNAEAVDEIKRHVMNLVDSNGHLILPHMVGDLCLVSLGDYSFCDKRYPDILFSVGYRAVTPTKQGPMLCEIRSRSEDDRPHFRVSRLVNYQVHDDSRQMWEDSEVLADGFDIEEVWNMAMRSTSLSSGVNGFGLRNNPTIRYYLRQLPPLRTIAEMTAANYSNEQPAGIRVTMEQSVKRGRESWPRKEEDELIPEEWTKKRRLAPNWRA